MKTAISIPDPIFQAAEQLAKQNGISRSQLYAAILSVYLKSHRGDGITERLNEIYEEATPTPIDPVIQALQPQSLPQDEW